MRFDVVLALYQRCSFRQFGYCEDLHIVERTTELAPRFFVYIGQKTINPESMVGVPVLALTKKRTYEKSIIYNNVYACLFGKHVCCDK